MEILYEVADGFETITFDATLKELHGKSSVATEHPVETGGTITDNIRRDRNRLSVEVMVTNHPIISPNRDGAEGSVRQLQLTETFRQFSRLAKASSSSPEPAEMEETSSAKQVNVLQFNGEFDRVASVRQKLEALMNASVDFTVVTPSKTYDAMTIIDMGEIRESSNKHSATWTMELVEIRFAESSVAESTEPLETRAQRRQRRGAQATQEPASEEERTFAAGLLEDFTGLQLMHSNRPNGRSLVQ